MAHTHQHRAFVLAGTSLGLASEAQLDVSERTGAAANARSCLFGLARFVAARDNDTHEDEDVLDDSSSARVACE